jgi:hypothetical protein
MTKKIVTSINYSLPEKERLALLPPKLKGGKVKSKYQARSLLNKVRKLKI